MKKVRVLCVGKIKEPYLRDGIAEYAKRLSRFCSFSMTELSDCADEPGCAQRESAAIAQKMCGFSVLTDIGGSQLTSPQLSRLMDDAYAGGASEITFIIGGSRGVTEEVRGKCNARISFGAATFPHQLMRLMLCEQIYRAMTISANLPYHK